jgi:dipeptidyl aminopeptidase/acylaminoacyl peptidase
MRAPKLSPDGKHVAFLAVLGTGRVGIALLDLSTGSVEPLVGGKDEDYEDFLWKGTDSIVFGGDFQGNEFPALRAIRLSNRRVIELSSTYRERVTDVIHVGAPIDWLPSDPEQILLWGHREPIKLSTTVNLDLSYWLANVRTGKRRAFSYHEVPHTSQIVLDHQGKVRARKRTENERWVEISDAKGNFRRVKSFALHEPAWRLHFIANDNETLYLTAFDSADTGALHRLSLSTGELSPALFTDPDAEIDAFVTSRGGGELYGVLLNRERPRYHWFDQGRAAVQATIDASLRGTFNQIIDASADDQVLLIHAYSDRDPGTYYVFDREKKRLVAIGRVNNRIDPARSQPMHAIRYQARDGRTIHGFLTRPANAEGQRVPLILLPHGGPFNIRDRWGYNAEVQFLASRGYAVLQPNFRGSSGYGREHLHAARLEWGRTMQDDLTDAVQWAIAEGIADPNRLAIYGASYGGYAALAGVTFTPELYRCAINYVGVTDLAILNRQTWQYHRDREIQAYYQHWMDNDPKTMRERSPVHHVERIRVPTLHAYGENDPRVDIQHWTRLRAQLDRHGKPYEYLRLEDEGHGFDRSANRIRFYSTMVAFLDRHLGDGQASETAAR